MIRILSTALVVVVAACGGGGGGSNPPADARPDAPVEPPPHRCDFADCEAGFARTCGDDPQTLDCSAFGATCGAFTDTESGAPFQWCSCGNLAEGDGFCLGGRLGVTCFDGLGGLADCGVGFVCTERPNGPFAIGCDCNNLADGICPAISCSSDPDCAQCTPDCAGRACGDNGCGGECGQCDLGDECTPEGTCVRTCVPDCTARRRRRRWAREAAARAQRAPAGSAATTAAAARAGRATAPAPRTASARVRACRRARVATARRRRAAVMAAAARAGPAPAT